MKRGWPAIAWTIAAGLSALAAGCGEEKVELPAGPVQVSADEIARQLNAVLAPVYQMAATADSHTAVPAGWGDHLKSQLNDVKGKVAAEPAYKEGMRSVVRKIEDQLKPVRDVQNVDLVLLLCDLIRYFEPNNARAERYMGWAQTLKNRPVVVIRGWYEPLDVPEEIVFVFVEVYLPDKNEVHHERVVVGDEFHNLRFKRIIGNKHGMMLEYIPTGDEFGVYGP
ncbi:MAG: hypothetical protein AMXMBFR4_06570 [Candidatus Hydrogenedentota bacterium]